MFDLIVGDHDSILLFGSDIQCDLENFSKSISKILTQKNIELELLYKYILNELDEFQNEQNSHKARLFFKKADSKSKAVKYKKLTEDIDKIALMLKLQQAQLIKESKLLEKLASLTDKCTKELEENITYAETILNEAKAKSSDDESIRHWILRLENKIDDLRISKTVSLQSKAQIMLLYNNDLLLTDKAATAVSSTIPLWRNQVSVLLAAEEAKGNTEASKLMQSNGKLKISLSELFEIHNEDNEIKNKLKKIIS